LKTLASDTGEGLLLAKEDTNPTNSPHLLASHRNFASQSFHPGTWWS